MNNLMLDIRSKERDFEKAIDKMCFSYVMFLVSKGRLGGRDWRGFLCSFFFEFY